jgi:HlyD family secretion protein
LVLNPNAIQNHRDIGIFKKNGGMKMNRKWIKRSIAIALAVLLLVGGYAVYRRLQTPKVNANTNYMVARAQIGDIELNISASGTVVAAVSQDVSPLISGAVEKLNVKEGDRVKAGDVIAVIDDESLQQEIEKIESNLKQQNLSLSKLKDSLSDFYIKAPADGRIKSLKAKVGEDVGTTTRTYGALAVISTDGKMKVAVKPQGDTSLTVGEKVLVKLEDGTELEGTVVEANASQGEQPGVGVGNIQVEIGRDDLPVGSKATVLKFDENSGQHIVVGEGTLDVSQGVSITGNNGKISVIYVKENSLVKRGDNLFRLNDSDVKTNIESQNLAIEQTQKELNNKKSQLSNTEVKSPIDGIITSLSARVGDQVQQGKTIATITDPTQLNVVVSVDELDIPKVKIGQKAEVKVDAFPDTVFEGEVVKIADIGQSSGGVTTYDVTISIQNPMDIKIGMSATAEIQVESRRGVVLLPIEAIQERAGEKYVIMASAFLQRDSESREAADENQTSERETSGNTNQASGSAATRNGNADIQPGNFFNRSGFRKVEVGLTNETYAEIISGVEAGEEVIIPVSGTGNTQNNVQGMLPGFGEMRGAFPQGQGGFDRPRIPSNNRQ